MEALALVWGGPSARTLSVWNCSAPQILLPSLPSVETNSSFQDENTALCREAGYFGESPNSAGEPPALPKRRGRNDSDEHGERDRLGRCHRRLADGFCGVDTERDREPSHLLGWSAGRRPV